MNDRVVAVFDDLANAGEAMSELIGQGVGRGRVTVKRVLQPGHRGFSDSEKVHALIHSPEIGDGDTTSQDAGTVILIVDMVERPEEPGDEEGADPRGLDPYDNTAIVEALDRLGAETTHVVEATPGLDL